MTQALSPVDIWVRRTGVFAGLVAILVPVLGFRSSAGRARGRTAGRATRCLNWPVTMVATVLYFLGGILLWRPVPIRLPRWMRQVCLGLGAALYFPGIGIYLWGYRTLGRLFSPSSSYGARLYADHQLVQEGPYRLVRHPMYLGVILAAWGALLLYRTWAMVAYTLSAMVVIVRARKEDDLLAAEFGEAWEAYRRRVPGWLPRLHVEEVCSARD